jgi:hypothetical protein
MKARILTTSSGLGLPVKAGMPCEMKGPFNSIACRLARSSAAMWPRFLMLPPRSTPGLPWQNTL